MSAKEGTVGTVIAEVLVALFVTFLQALFTVIFDLILDIDPR
ncbi:MAG TPA: hypothetical protein PKI11_01970 [Candidatus Hydrogenedentes bacterium]|nr:hypothetical protein [Candidatus Hydrogenedentota bacterium]